MPPGVLMATVYDQTVLSSMGRRKTHGPSPVTDGNYGLGDRMSSEKRELDVTAGDRQIIRVISAGPDKALVVYDGKLGIQITKIVPDMELWPNGLQQVTFRFVLTASDGTLLLASGETTMEVGNVALLDIQYKGREVGIEWLQELELRTSENMKALMQAALDKQAIKC